MMKRIDNLRQKVHQLYTTGDAEVSDWVGWAYKNHVLVVADLAGKLAKRHNANAEFAVAGALLHDVADAVMPRKDPRHEAESLKLAAQLLQEAGYDKDEVDTVVNEIIKPHSCRELMPTVLEGKVVAAADGAAHFLTDFYPYFCWQHYGAEDYEGFKAWLLEKIERDYTKKLFFKEVKEEVKPRYDALKLIFS